MAVEFTKEELLTVSRWATDKADASIKKNGRINIYQYELAEAIFKKVHREIRNME